MISNAPLYKLFFSYNSSSHSISFVWHLNQNRIRISFFWMGTVTLEGQRIRTYNYEVLAAKYIQYINQMSIQASFTDVRLNSASECIK